MNMKRQRGRNNGRNNKPHMPTRSQNFESSGPEVRIRGNAYQVLEKYLALARDATAAGDRVAAENFYQHAEHYFRVINANNDGHNRPQGGQQPPNQNHQQHPQQYQQHPNQQSHQPQQQYDQRMTGQPHDGAAASADQGAGPQPLTGPSNPGDSSTR